jgi:hypothetical protein
MRTTLTASTLAAGLLALGLAGPARVLAPSRIAIRPIVSPLVLTIGVS